MQTAVDLIVRARVAVEIKSTAVEIVNRTFDTSMHPYLWAGASLWIAHKWHENECWTAQFIVNKIQRYVDINDLKLAESIVLDRLKWIVPRDDIFSLASGSVPYALLAQKCNDVFWSWDRWQNSPKQQIVRELLQS